MIPPYCPSLLRYCPKQTKLSQVCSGLQTRNREMEMCWNIIQNGNGLRNRSDEWELFLSVVNRVGVNDWFRYKYVHFAKCKSQSFWTKLHFFWLHPFLSNKNVVTSLQCAEQKCTDQKMVYFSFKCLHLDVKDMSARDLLNHLGPIKRMPQDTVWWKAQSLPPG